MQLIGYALINASDGSVVQRHPSYGVDSNGCPKMALTLPNGDQVHCPKVGDEVQKGYLFVERRQSDAQPPTKWHSQVAEEEKFDGTALVTSPKFSEVEDIVPQSVSMMKAKIVLLRAGILDQVDAQIAASGNRELQLAWEYSEVIERHSAQMKVIADLFQITDAQIDGFFRQAVDLIPEAAPT